MPQTKKRAAPTTPIRRSKRQQKDAPSTFCSLIAAKSRKVEAAAAAATAPVVNKRVLTPKSVKSKLKARTLAGPSTL